MHLQEMDFMIFKSYLNKFSKLQYNFSDNDIKERRVCKYKLQKSQSR